MSAPALTVRCGSCQNVINVPASLLERLLDVQRFNCPHCKMGQQLSRETLAAILHKPQASNGLGPTRGTAYQNIYNAMRGRSTNGIHSTSEANGGSDAADMRYSRNRRIHVLEDDDEDAAASDDGDEDAHEAGEIFADYRPSKLHIGRPHPDPVVETATLAAVEPPDVTYKLHLEDLISDGTLSGLQLESIVYACQRHDQMLPGGIRCGFFIGDGAGVGKGRTIAGLILENWRCGRKRHLWISIGSDLLVDAKRDLEDVNASDIGVHPLRNIGYGRLDGSKLGVVEGVVFLTYSALISGCDNGLTRIDQLVEWCSQDFDGLIIFDECHKAKNLVPEAGSKPTKVGRLVLELQQKLPRGRVVYCSATGASEPRNMGYMERLGMWGEHHPAFTTFAAFLDVIGSRGVGALEMVAMDMKARGMYVCRTLSFAGAEFEVVESALEEPVKSQYKVAAEMWNQLRREFLYAIEQAAARSNGKEEPPKKGINSLWRYFWAAQQRFFRHMCMAAKVPSLVRMTQQALQDGKCVVIGLQSTGEARTQDVVAERGEELDDFVSGPRELLLKLVEDHYPMPLNPDEKIGQPPVGPKGASKRKRTGAALGRAKKRALAAAAAASGSAEPIGEAANGGIAASGVVDLDCQGGEEDEHWERKEGSGPVGTSYADSLSATEEGRCHLEQLRDAHKMAAKRKDQVKTCMAGLDLPHNPLDMLIDLLGGPDKVAEMTGRKGRLVRMKQKEGEEDTGGKMGVKWEARNASGVGSGVTLELINVLERKLFLDGTKLVAVISEAASAGISLHADKRANNQLRRVHLTLELPWSADKAIQQFGRSHRANQAHGPQYRLLFTPLGGERRFASSVARRLESLGALTQGDRKAGPSLSAFNYESTWGQRALKRFYRVILGDELSPCKITACVPDNRGNPPLLSESVFLGKARAQLLGVGIIKPLEDAVHVNLYMSQEGGAPAGVGKVADPDAKDVGRFLNRLLGMVPEWQSYLFDFFQAMLEYVIAEAKRDGKYQDGIVDVRATSVTIKGPARVVRTDEPTGATTLLYTVVTDRGVSWEQAYQMHPSHPMNRTNEVVDLEGSAGASSQRTEGAAFCRSLNRLPGTNKHAIILAIPHSSGSERTYTIVRPNTGRQLKPMPHAVIASKYGQVDIGTARRLWEEAHRESYRQHGVGNRLKELHLLSGLVLPIWPQIEMCLNDQVRAAERRLNIVRLETTGVVRKRLVGVLLPSQVVTDLLLTLGVRNPPAAVPNEVIRLED